MIQFVSSLIRNNLFTDVTDMNFTDLLYSLSRLWKFDMISEKHAGTD